MQLSKLNKVGSSVYILRINNILQFCAKFWDTNRPTFYVEYFPPIPTNEKCWIYVFTPNYSRYLYFLLNKIEHLRPYEITPTPLLGSRVEIGLLKNKLPTPIYWPLPRTYGTGMYTDWYSIWFNLITLFPTQLKNRPTIELMQSTCTIIAY